MEAKPYAFRLPAPPAFNLFCDLNLHAFPIETDEGPPPLVTAHHHNYSIEI